MGKVRVINTETNLQPYFRELVENAISHQHLKVSDMSQFYVVNMLNRFMKTGELFDWERDHYEEIPLAQLLDKALNSSPSTKIKVLKKMGDNALYISGFFSDYIESKLVNLDYYVSMGECAYKNLSGVFAREKTFCELYNELAVNFIGFKDILLEVRNSGRIISNATLVKLYETWLKTGDPLIKEKLQREGIVPKKS